MIETEQRRFVVTPRVFSPETGDSIPLVDEILALHGTSAKRIRIVGAGRSTALRFLGDNLGDTSIDIVDDLSSEALGAMSMSPMLVFAANLPLDADFNLRLVPWSQDEWIEYLLGTHPAQCGSVMERLQQTDDEWLANGSSYVWPMVLDAMAESSSIQTIEAAIETLLWSLVPNENVAMQIADMTIDQNLKHASWTYEKIRPKLSKQLLRCLSVDGVRLALAVRRFVERVENLGTDHPTGFMSGYWPLPFIECVANRIQSNPGVHSNLKKISRSSNNESMPLLASLLLRVDPTWRPPNHKKIRLSDAHLENARWNRVHLQSADLRNASLEGADLCESNLKNAMIGSASFENAKLRGADLATVLAYRTNLKNADLTEAKAFKSVFRSVNFDRACFHRADLTATSFEQSELRDADFRNAILRKARFSSSVLDGCDFRDADLMYAALANADLRNVLLDGAFASRGQFGLCLLEDVSVTRAEFCDAELSGALLTGSKFRNCNLSGAKLCHAKMAEIDWEHCILQDADFSNCQFHMGSSRSGLVGSPYPSHGTRTGFYTDEFHQQYFKQPEEIRKANLCHCDLRGANVHTADFYLVDLRGAKYTADQHNHFQKTGAILEDYS